LIESFFNTIGMYISAQCFLHASSGVGTSNHHNSNMTIAVATTNGNGIRQRFVDRVKAMYLIGDSEKRMLPWNYGLSNSSEM